MLRPRSFAMLLLLVSSCSSLFVGAQWVLQSSNTAASLRGIAAVSDKVAWASGAGGTVLRTKDGGHVWTVCVVPAAAATLDFRGVQAWDENTAIVMSSGPGELSRLYKTTDGCKSWTTLLVNTDKEGFWDAIQFVDQRYGVLLGDPVDGHFVVLVTQDGGLTWKPSRAEKEAAGGRSVFAASNSALLVNSPANLAFCTGGPGGAAVLTRGAGPTKTRTAPGEVPWSSEAGSEDLESASHSASAGCFSLGTNHEGKSTLVAVGGDYAHPEEQEDTAWTTAGTEAANQAHPLFRFVPASTTPHGYRSAVAYSPQEKLWIAVGPNGTDVSADDGKNWHSVLSLSSPGDAKDGQWNALSLPFVVGAKGRIGRLDPDSVRGKLPTGQ